jgi:hypothetical protein
MDAVVYEGNSLLWKLSGGSESGKTLKESGGSYRDGEDHKKSSMRP